MTERVSWDQYFTDMLPVVGARSTCDRGRCGAIITRDNTILSTGYAGAPKGFPHCDDVGHLFEYVFNNMKEKHCIRTIHAEQNAIYHAAEIGASLKGATLYSTMFPCFRCAMAIVQVGIIRVVALHEYQGDLISKNIFFVAGITHSCLNNTQPYT